jgi:hypothetical protein
VRASGTWHRQISGRKTWLLRPALDAAAWSSRREGETNRKKRKRGPGPGRIRVDAEPGDVLFIDTTAWWHETALPATGARASSGVGGGGGDDLFSLSVAREFFLASERGGSLARASEAAAATCSSGGNFTNVDGAYATRDAVAGEVVCVASDFAEDPGAFRVGRSSEPNCVLAEDPETGEAALVVLRDVRAGDAFTIEHSDEEEGDEEGEEESGEEAEEDDEG